VLPSGDLAMVAPAVTHRLPHIFRDPECYDPDRFAPGREEDRRTPFALIGFGGGKHRCIGSGRWTLSKRREVVTPDLTFRLLTDDPAVHRQVVLDGGGIAILPLYMALESAMAKRFVPILPGWQPKPVVPCALYSDSARLTPKVEVFLDFIEKYLGTDLDPRLRGTKARDCFTDPKQGGPPLDH